MYISAFSKSSFQLKTGLKYLLRRNETMKVFAVAYDSPTLSQNRALKAEIKNIPENPFKALQACKNFAGALFLVISIFPFVKFARSTFLG